MAQRLFVFGLGYSAGVLARRLVGEGWSVAGTRRAAGDLTALEREGYAAFSFDRETALDAAGRKALREATHILSSVPPDDAGDPVLDAYAAEFATAPSLAWAGYLSTTGVYGDTDGAWVDENTPPRPTGPRGRRRVEAERAWLALAGAATPAHIFRLAGIYGPGRNALAQLRAGTARRIDKPGHQFSRIHVEDIAGVLAASMARPRPGGIYNVCDDRPASGRAVIEFAAELLDLDPPPLLAFEQAQLSEMARSFYADRRLVRNDLIKKELGVGLAYPDYQAGLRALMAAGECAANGASQTPSI